MHGFWNNSFFNSNLSDLKPSLIHVVMYTNFLSQISQKTKHISMTKNKKLSGILITYLLINHEHWIDKIKASIHFFYAHTYNINCPFINIFRTAQWFAPLYFCTIFIYLKWSVITYSLNSTVPCSSVNVSIFLNLLGNIQLLFLFLI